MTDRSKLAPRVLSKSELEKLAGGAKVHESVEDSPTPAQLRQAKEVAFTLTLDPEMVEDIERLRRRPLKLSRRAWIRLAIAEKIARDK